LPIAHHIFGLLSPGGVHSHEEQIFAAIHLAATRGAKRVYSHAFLDGRDTLPRSAGPSLEKTDTLFEELGCGRTATICGRYYAMDRDNRWERTERAYRLLTESEAEQHAATSTENFAAVNNAGVIPLEFIARDSLAVSGHHWRLVPYIAEDFSSPCVPSRSRLIRSAVLSEKGL
jgi:bisphosphoglycerate-independent phosphoglycerate mutase (AlkP superfamily)